LKGFFIGHVDTFPGLMVVTKQAFNSAPVTLQPLKLSGIESKKINQKQTKTEPYLAAHTVKHPFHFPALIPLITLLFVLLHTLWIIPSISIH
jgi:hypothetical protein